MLWILAVTDHLSVTPLLRVTFGGKDSAARTAAAACDMASDKLQHGASSRFADFWTLTKPDVNFLVLISTLVGYYLASTGPLRFLPLFNTLLGVFLVASGTATLNQYVERGYDARMRRTSRRPLPAGRLRPATALWFGLILSVSGGAYLAVSVNRLASALSLLTLVSYLGLYTPLKRRTSWCTFVGAFPGAMPPLIGWVASRGSLGPEAWALYAILFLWQFPHFLAIAWMYREDYKRAGYMMLPAGEDGGRSMARQILAYSMMLIPVSLLPVALRQTGLIYLCGASVLGLGFLACGARVAFSRSNALARRLLFASIVYLPAVFGLMMLDKI